MESSGPLNDKNAYFFGLHITRVETVSEKNESDILVCYVNTQCRGRQFNSDELHHT